MSHILVLTVSIHSPFRLARALFQALRGRAQTGEIPRWCCTRNANEPELVLLRMDPFCYR